MSSPYPNLFASIDIHGCQLPNRIIMGSMHTGLEEEKDSLRAMATFYRERAEGGVGLIITGGVSPNKRGAVAPKASRLTTSKHAKQHRTVTDAVHEANGKIALQILHTGRYAFHPLAVAPSAVKSPISPFKPWRLTSAGVQRTIKQFIRCARLAEEAGYDGVEIMGSEGYLINQFLVTHTNKRTDRWGGVYENRMRFALEIVDGIRAEVSSQFLIIFRLSMLDLIPNGSTWPEVCLLAKRLESSGVSIINTGIGWHEARVPTIATSVPRQAFSWVTEKLKQEGLTVPLSAVNRINTPEVAEDILQNGVADFVTMARPLLADAQFANKAAQGRALEINTCIACNQACLDHVFKQRRATCLVNPRACYEEELPLKPTITPKNIAVIGAGPAGLECAKTLAERGHTVTVFEKATEIGGQFHYAKQVPGKAEFHETIRYYNHALKQLGVTITFGSDGGWPPGEFDEYVIATGVRPRRLTFEGVDHPSIMAYDEVFRNPDRVGRRVAIIGAGGIGFDMASFLAVPDEGANSDHTTQTPAYVKHWGIDQSLHTPGGLSPNGRTVSKPKREIFVFQRSSSKPGSRLGKTTGWIHRTHLKDMGVHFFTGVSYQKWDGKSLHFSQNEKAQTLQVDTVVVCAGQESVDDLASNRANVHLIGGAKKAEGVDAKIAIREGHKLALTL